MAVDKYDNPYFREYPELKERQMQLDAAARERLEQYMLQKANLREHFTNLHYQSSDYAAFRIPFESSNFYREFEAAIAKIAP